MPRIRLSFRQKPTANWQPWAFGLSGFFRDYNGNSQEGDSATNIKLSVENGVNAAGKTVLAARSFDGFALDITDDLALELGTELERRFRSSRCSGRFRT